LKAPTDFCWSEVTSVHEFSVGKNITIVRCPAFWYSDYGGETDISLNCGSFYGPVICLWMNE
jgi:hypothetical protein